MTVYATDTDLSAFTGIAAPADADRQLKRASELIDDVIATALFAVDAESGLPTDSVLAQALRDATCAQVEFWTKGHEEDDILGPADEVNLAGVKAPGHELAPRAARILRINGLYSSDPVLL